MALDVSWATFILLALCAGHHALRKFQSGFRGLHLFPAAGLHFVELASANACLLIPAAYADHSERFRQGHVGVLWLLPPLFSGVGQHAWIFTLGLFVLGVYWSCGLMEIHWEGLDSAVGPLERVRLELVGLLILIASIITPYGTELLLYPSTWHIPSRSWWPTSLNGSP